MKPGTQQSPAKSTLGYTRYTTNPAVTSKLNSTESRIEQKRWGEEGAQIEEENKATNTGAHSAEARNTIIIDKAASNVRTLFPSENVELSVAHLNGTFVAGAHGDHSPFAQPTVGLPMSAKKKTELIVSMRLYVHSRQQRGTSVCTATKSMGESAMLVHPRNPSAG